MLLNEKRSSELMIIQTFPPIGLFRAGGILEKEKEPSLIFRVFQEFFPQIGIRTPDPTNDQLLSFILLAKMVIPRGSTVDHESNDAPKEKAGAVHKKRSVASGLFR
ncbi:MAG TPA: hypothetical protein PKH10_00985 [bacterium]|nr:hypothetical protein [bacterium]HSA33744.1 hypothetical protein [bacterium]